MIIVIIREFNKMSEIVVLILQKKLKYYLVINYILYN